VQLLAVKKRVEEERKQRATMQMTAKKRVEEERIHSELICKRVIYKNPTYHVGA
jgi:hypothetical protein